MIFEKTDIEGCYVISPEVYKDSRGYFTEYFNRRIFEDFLKQPVDFVQDNQSLSRKGVLRGLHFQQGAHSQAKLIRVQRGAVQDVVVDLRRESRTFGRHISIELSESNGKNLFIPKGMAHGFLALEDDTLFTYKCDNYYYPASERGIIFSDSVLGIHWKFPEEELILSAKDRNLPGFRSHFP